VDQPFEVLVKHHKRLKLLILVAEVRRLRGGGLLVAFSCHLYGPLERICMAAI
jgi:hypothetical protein